MSDSDCQRCRGGGCEWCHNTGKAPTFRTRPTTGDILAQGPVNGMGERDQDGAYVLLTFSVDGGTDMILRRMRISRGQAELLKAEIHNILSLDLDRLTGSVVDAYTLAPNDEDAKREAVRASIERGIKP